MNDKQGDFTQDVQELNSTMKQMGDCIANDIGETLPSLQEKISMAADKISQEVLDFWNESTTKTVERSLKKLLKEIRKAEKVIADFQDSVAWDTLQQLFPDAQEWLEEMISYDMFTYGLLANVLYVLPKMMPEVEKYLQDYPGFNSLKKFIPLEDVEDGLEEVFTIDDYQWPPDAGFIVCYHAMEKRPQISLLPILPANNTIKTFSSPDTLVSKELFAYKNLPVKDMVHVERRGTKPIPVEYSAILLDQNNISTTYQLDPFDRVVFDAAITLYLQNPYNSFTERHILQAFSGQHFFSDTSDAMIERIHNSIEKMRITLVTINVKLQFDTWNIRGEEYGVNESTGEYKSYLLPVQSGKFRTRNGKEVTAYSMIVEPPLLSYAKATKQLVTYPYESLQPKKRNGKPLSTTPDAVIINHYLQRRVSIMKNKKENKRLGTNENKIRYESIYGQFGEKPSDPERAKTERVRIREKTTEILDSMKRDKLITGYKIHYKGEGQGRKGSAPESIEIDL